MRGAAWWLEGYGGEYGKQLVDEDMIVLRKRLREMENVEKEEAEAHTGRSARGATIAGVTATISATRWLRCRDF